MNHIYTAQSSRIINGENKKGKSGVTIVVTSAKGFKIYFTLAFLSAISFAS